MHLLSAACLVWAGVVIGVSFLATPAKFLAPTLTLPVALYVGRHTFGVLRPVEIAWAALTLVLAWLGRSRLKPRLRAGLAALWATLALELRASRAVPSDEMGFLQTQTNPASRGGRGVGPGDDPVQDAAGGRVAL